MNINISSNDLIAQINEEMEADELLDFIADLADIKSFYRHSFRDDIIKRMEEDK